MNVADELQKLEALRWNGTLTDAEFAQAKAALLARLAPPEPTPANDGAADALAEQLAEVRYQNELERIDREWGMEREKYMVADKHGHRSVPTVGASIGGAVVVGVFGVFWTVMAFSITNSGPNFGPDFGPPPIFRTLFPLFGVAFAVGGVWMGIVAAQKAEAYNQAHAAYQRRRAAVKKPG